MKIDRHISTLLYDHDCVIVPSFGGFLASYQPSQVQAIQHTFYPPSKKIAFNVFLKNNDGLLANYVAQKERLTYAEALKDIERFRLDVVKLLDSGKHILIEDVGTLFYDHHRNLQFEPVKHINYLEDAFGLMPVQSPPVKREEQRKKIERQIREAVSIRSSVKPPQVKTFSKRSTAKKVVNTLLLSGALMWFSFNIYLIAPHKVNVSSLNPFSYSMPANRVEAPAAEKAEAATSAPATASIQKEAGSSENAVANNEPSPDDHVVVVTSPPRKEITSELRTIIGKQKNFFVIAGVFREPGNAEKLVESLKQEGFSGAEIVNPTASVKKVCYSSFAFRKDAIEALQQLHAAKKDGWILEK